jgi:ProP effector
VRTRWRGGSGWLARGERIEPWPINEPNCFRSGMPQPRDPARTSSAPRQTKKAADPAHRPRPPQGPVTAREWDVAHAAALRALLTQPPTVLPNQVGDPLLPLQIGIWGALVALLRPGAEPEALARALRAYTRSTGYFMACARKDAMRYDLDARAVGPVSEEHRTGAVKAVQGRRRRSAAQQGVGDAAA